MIQDGKIDIATGAGANSKNWKNIKISWSDLVSKLSVAVQTTETFKEFMQYSKEEQGKIKDVGGYVGGYVRGGRRKPENIIHRQLLTLDIDFATKHFWEDFILQFDYAAVLHATHKHHVSSPRYRLILPMSRETSPDEYVAVARWLAGQIGIDLFDKTTFQPSRLMFWPSVPKDVIYYFEEQEGEWIDVDEVLATYADWKDSSLWPTASSEFDTIKNHSKKQQDPEEKTGVIGAFCRTYSIEGAIETFLSDSYTPTTGGRYTYLKGSAASGLVTYDNKFAFSHHGTDPSGGKLCNAFDLVRIHKFGHEDSSEKSQVSFKLMEDFVRADKKTKRTIAEESINNARYDFAEIVGGIDEDKIEIDLTWTENLDIDTKGNYLSSSNNLNLIFNNDNNLKDLFKHNKFDNKKYVFRSTPWRKIKTPEPIRDVDYAGVRNYLESIYNIVGKQKIEDSLELEFEKQSFHPVRDYLKGLKWDGTQRVDELLIDYFNAEDNIYTREAIRKMLVGAVGRILNPGCKFDYVLTLVGAQGTGKSTFINKLGKAWFSDTFLTVQGKEALEQIQGAWLIEMAELAGLRKAEVEAVKHFISKQEDSFRAAYARTSETNKRQCVFFGTTNNRDFLRDPSGNRRFLPIDVCNTTDSFLSVFEMTENDIDQIWAEAVELYKSGETLYLSPEAEKLANKEQKGHSELDDRAGIIEEYLNTKLPENWKSLDLFARRMYLADEEKNGTVERQNVCIAQIWCECLGKEKEDMDRYKTREINDILRSLEGWQASNSTKSFKIYGTQRFYNRMKPL